MPCTCAVAWPRAHLRFPPLVVVASPRRAGCRHQVDIKEKEEHIEIVKEELVCIGEQMEGYIEEQHSKTGTRVRPPAPPSFLPCLTPPLLSSDDGGGPRG